MTASTTRPAKPRRARHDPDAYAAKWAALSARLEKFREDAGDEAAQEAQLLAALATFGEHLSERNALLTVMQDPGATEVRTYRQWQDSGRQVTAYPLGEEGITLVRFRGTGKAGDTAQADAAFGSKPEQHDVTADDARDAAAKPSSRFGLYTVHDIRRTVPLTCGECSRPMRRTGYDAEAKRDTWAHQGVTAAQAGHPARQRTRAEIAARTALEAPVA
jgi:hypothetical protein